MSTDSRKSQLGQPTWEVATLFPNQGQWSVHEYLHLKSGRLIEYADGTLEVLPMPTELHQLIAAFFFEQLQAHIRQFQLGVAVFAPLRIQVRDGKFREPDVVFMLAAHRHRRTPLFWIGADLVVEVVSEDDPQRDLVVKREEYAQAGIDEYWIVDPRDRSIAVLQLDAARSSYIESGRFTSGQTACSILLNGFTIDVQQVFQQPAAQ